MKNRNVSKNNFELLIAKKHKHHVFCIYLCMMKECQLAFYFDFIITLSFE